MPLDRDCINLQNRVWQTPNEWNGCLDDEAMFWREILRRGGLEMCCPSMVQKRYQAPPFVSMPPEGERMRLGGGVTLASMAENVESTLIDETMPIGWDGVAENFSFTFTGTGFDDGSGDIAWRVKVGARFIPDYSNVVFQLNNLAQGFTDAGAYVRLLSLQRIQVFAELATGALGRLNGGRVNAQITGWKYPKR